MGNGRKTSDLLVLSVLFSLSLLIATLDAALSFDKKCGELNCTAHQYCRGHDETCQSCEIICDQSSHNFDKVRCTSDCQDYLHDIRYEKPNNGLEDLQRDVTILKVIVVICLVVIVLVVAALVAFTVYFWRVIHPSSSNGNNNNEKSSSHKGMELPTVYNNKYAPSSRNVSPSPPPGSQPCMSPSHSASPSKSEQMNNSINSSVHSPSVPGTVSTLVLNGSSSSSLQNTLNSTDNGQQRFRREPSESTLPDYIPSGTPGGRDSHYSHHV